MLEQGRALLALGCGAVLMKGGHLDDAESPDWLFTREGEQRFTAPRVQTKNTHGTGCTLSAALAALRPRHADWAATVTEAKAGCRRPWPKPTPGGGPRHRTGTPFPRLVVNGSVTGQQNLLKKCPPGWKIG